MSSAVFWGIVVFCLAYLINITYISVFYHRGLAHRAVELPNWLVRWIAASGVWLTGLDPKAWVCMHRMHHIESDTPRDPHSPVHLGIFGTLFGQLRSYERCLMALMKHNKRYEHTVHDLDFPVHWLYKKKLWLSPYVLHIIIAVVLGVAFGSIFLGVAYFAGIMSHPIQGWLVNAFGHAKVSSV